MTSPASRAGVLAAIGVLSVLAPVIGVTTVLVFVAAAIVVLVIPRNTRVFQHLATGRDREKGRLDSLIGYILVVGVLASFGTIDAFGLSATVFSMGIVILTGGNLGCEIVRMRSKSEFWSTAGFISSGLLLGYLTYLGLAMFITVSVPDSHTLALFLATTGALAGTLYRTEITRNDPVAVATICILLWFFSFVGTEVNVQFLVLAIALSFCLGILAYGTGTASIPGMLSGTLLAFLTLVLGGINWFIVLVAFFAIGGIATKYRYEEKAARGVAEGDQGTRGTANVMSNGLAPMCIVIAWATVRAVDLPDLFDIPDAVFILAFAGAVSTALADTLASEIGALYDNPRLITSFEQVRPGTDGAVTLEGHLAGLVGAGIIAILVVSSFPEETAWSGIVVLVAGFIGMSADSLLGATVEGSILGNNGVNLLATCVGAGSAVIGALALSILI